jgi:PAS domain S-box-containing protein
MSNAPVLQAFRHVRVPVITVDAAGQISNTNAAADELFGYHETLIGRVVCDILEPDLKLFE